MPSHKEQEEEEEEEEEEDGGWAGKKENVEEMESSSLTFTFSTKPSSVVSKYS